MNIKSMLPKILRTTLSYAAGIITALVGITVLIGWQFDITILKTFGFGGVSMKANTAAAFILAGLALIFLKRQNHFANILVRFLALVIMLVGILSLCQHFFGWDFGLDEFLFRETAQTLGTSHPGLMAPNTALNFLFIGLAFLFITFQRFRNSFFIEFSLIFPLSISIIGLTGYITGLVELTGPAAYTQMAANTASTFIFLCIGVLVTVYQQQHHPISIEQKLFAGLIALVAIILFISFLSISGIQSLHQAGNWVENAQMVKNQLETILSHILEVQSCDRGFVITADEKYILPREESSRSLPPIINNLYLQLTDQSQQQTIAELEKFVEKRIAFSDKVISTRRIKGEREAGMLIKTDQGNALTNKIRIIIAKMIGEENKLLQFRNKAEHEQSIRTQLIILLSLGVQILLLVFIFLFVKKDISGRKKAEEKLSLMNEELEDKVEERTAEVIQSEKKYRNLIDTMSEGLGTQDKDGLITYMNKRGCEMIGYTFEELIGKSVTFLFDDENQKILSEQMATRRKGELQSYEIAWLHKDGRKIDTIIAPSPLFDDNGNFIGSVAVFTDITERKLAEEKISAEQKKAQQYFQFANVMLVILDHTGKVSKINEKGCKILGFTEEEIVGKDWFKTVLPKNIGKDVRNSFEEIMSGRIEEVEFYENPIVNRNGEERLIEWHNVLLRDPDGKPIGTLSSGDDITERKQQEEEIISQKNRFAQLFDNSPIATVLLDNQDKVVLINESFSILFGYFIEEIKGKSLTDLIVPPELKEEAKFYSDETREGNHVNKESCRRKKDGSDIFVQIIGVPVTVNDKTTGIYGMYVNLTERKKAEIEIQNSNRVYRVLGNINQTIVRVTDAQTLYNEVCRIAVDDGKFNMAWIGMIDEQTNKFIPVAAAGNAQEYIKTINIDLNDKILGNGPIGRCIKSGVHYLANDIANDPEMIPWRENALRLGNKSSAAFPIKVFGKTVGAFLFYSSKTFFFNDAEVKLLDELAMDVAFALEFIENNGKRKQQEEDIRNMNAALEIKVEERTEQLAKTNEILHKEIEERMQVEIELQKSEKNVRLLLDSTAEAIYGVDTEGNCTFCNSSCITMLGYERTEQLLGQNMHSLIHHSYSDGSKFQVEDCSIYKAFITEKGTHIDDEVFWRADGNSFPVEYWSYPIFKNGSISGAVVTFLDITERKRAGNEIKKAKTEAEQANVAKSEFLSRMSHELRTPMNSILGFAQLMDMGELNPAHKKGVNQILKSGKHLLDLINEVLDISKIEAGHLTISPEPVEIGGIISEAIDIVRHLAEENQISLEFDPSISKEFFVKADRQRLKQVLLNLINNAVKYNRVGGSVKVECGIGSRQLAVSSQQQTEDSRLKTVRISVTDTGMGLVQENIEKLFNPFVRIDAERTGVEGTGLGLTISKKLIEAMGGKIGVESERGKGSTFWVELMQSESQIERHDRLSDLTKPEEGKVVLTGTLLYIEDNFSNIQLVEQILETHRPSIRLITDMYGKNAVQFAIDYKPDLILLDLDLPDIHGNEVIKLLQSEPRTAAIPVIILSADAMTKQIEQLMEAGAKDYLTKPIDVVQFLNVVDGILSEKS